MANKYWVGGSGTWDDSDTTHWSLSSGGASGAPVPSHSYPFDDVFFDANSFSADGQTVTFTTGALIDAKNFDASGITHNVNFSFGSNGSILTVTGSLTLSPKLTITSVGQIVLGLSGVAPYACTVDQAGASIHLATIEFSGTSTAYTLISDLSINGEVLFTPGLAFNADTFNVTAGRIRFLNGGAPLDGAVTVNMGSGTWTVDGSITNYLSAANSFTSTHGDLSSAITINGNTSTLQIKYGADITLDIGTTLHLYDVHLMNVDNTYYTTSDFGIGSNSSLHNLTLDPGLNMTLTGNVTYTVNAFSAVGNATYGIRLIGGANISSRSTIYATTSAVAYVEVNDSIAAGPGSPFLDVIGGIDDGENVNWIFPTPNSPYLRNVFLSFQGTDGIVQLMNGGNSDNGSSINYELETQEIEFGSRIHEKSISDKIVVFAKDGVDSSLIAYQDGEAKSIPVSLSERINIGDDINLKGNFFRFKWFGNTATSQPQFEGILLESVQDLGVNYVG